MAKWTEQEINDVLATIENEEDQIAFLQEVERVQTGAGGALSGVDAIKPTHPFQKQHELKFAGPFAPSFGSISGEDFAEMLPGLASIPTTVLGAILGGPGGAVGMGSLGAGAGEAGRQLIRKSQGFSAAPGIAQEKLDLDPDSPEARMAGIGMEMGGGALAEALGFGAARLAAPTRKQGLKQFAKAITDTNSPKELKSVMDSIAPMQDQFPVGTRGRIARRTEPRMEATGEEVAEVYRRYGDRPASYTPAEREMLQDQKNLIETPSYPKTVTKKVDNGTIDSHGNPVFKEEKHTLMTSPTLTDEDLFRELGSRRKKLRARQTAREEYGLVESAGERKGHLTALEVWEQRRQAGTEANRAASGAYTSPAVAKNLVPKARAAMTERGALRNILNEVVPEGKIADDKFHALATIYEKATDAERGHFLARWGTARAIGGGAGTGLGLVAATPSLVRSTLSKGLNLLSYAMKYGDEAKAMHIFRALAAPEGDEIGQ
jgi:hypothetical protein